MIRRDADVERRGWGRGGKTAGSTRVLCSRIYSKNGQVRDGASSKMRQAVPEVPQIFGFDMTGGK